MLLPFWLITQMVHCMRERWLTLFLRPYVLALIPTIVVIILIPDLFSKYHFNAYKSHKVGLKEDIIKVADLDNNGKEEYIRMGYNGVGQVSLQIRRQDKSPLGQWNNNGHPAHFISEITLHDYNNNGCLDIFYFYHNKSAILLHVIDASLPIGQKTIFNDTVTTTYTNIHTSDFHATTIKFTDLNNDGRAEWIFGLNAGFSLSPRNIFIIDPIKNTIKKTPYLCNRQAPEIITDFLGDRTPEIFSTFSSSANDTSPIDTSCTDYNAYFTIFSQDGQSISNLLIDTIPYSSIYPAILLSNKDTILYVISNSSNYDKQPHTISTLNRKGEITKTINIPFRNIEVKQTPDLKNLYLFDHATGKIYTINSRIQINYLTEVIPAFSYIKVIPTKNTNKFRWAALNNSFNRIYVFEHDFKSYYYTDIPKTDDIRHLFDYYYLNDTLHIYTQMHDIVYDYTFTKNPYYLLKYPFYLGIYLSFTGIFWLLARGQQYQQQKKRQLEKDIASLQMKAIKNQVDPHFVFNAINTMSSMMMENDKRNADRFITRFSRFMRHMLRTSDKIECSLEEELTIVENYLQLQQLRFNNTFTYQVSIEDKVSLSMIIPKHMLFTHIENAIKHGIAHKDGKGLIKIIIEDRSRHLFITITDNGVGDAATTIDNPHSTGKGEKIMKEIFSMYKKLHNKQIKYTRSPLYDDNGTSIGMKVELTIEK